MIRRVARQLGVGDESYALGEAAEVDAGVRAGMTSAERAELAELRKERRDLRRADEILKAASAPSATELDGRPRKYPLRRCLPELGDRGAEMGVCSAPEVVPAAEVCPVLEAPWKQNYSVDGRRKLHKAACRAVIDLGRDRPPG